MDVPVTWFAAAVAVLVLLLVTWVTSVRHYRRKIRLLDSGKRSQSTRYGQITEQFAPFMASWPWDPKSFRFIGSPIDGVQFNDDGVVFVEIKSANSRLSPIQQQVKAHIEAGRVMWRQVTVG